MQEGSYTDRFGAIDKYAARLLMLSFVLPMQWQVWAVMATCVYFVVRTAWSKQPIPSGNFLWAMALGSGFLLFLIAVPFTPPEYKKAVLHVCERRVSFLLVPLFFAIISPMFKTVLMKELMYFVYGVFVSCVAANVNFAYQHFYMHADSAPLSHVAYRTMIHLFTDVHPTYLSLYLCLSVCIMLLAPRLSIRVHAFLLNMLLLLCFIFLLALGAKTPILALVLILVHYAWANRGDLRRYRLLFAGLILTAAAACIFIPFIGQRMGEIVQYFKAKEQGNLTDNSVLARKAIWDMDIALVKQHWLTGIGPGRVQPVMEAESAARSIPTPYHDPHNEYVYEWLCFGIAGIVVFITILLIHFRQAIRGKDHLYLYLLILFCATFFTETVLSLQRGILLYSVFTALLFYQASGNGKLHPDELKSEGKPL